MHWFLGLVLWGCFLALTGGRVLGWVLEGDITVRAKGALQPTSRYLVKSAIDGHFDEVCVSAGDRVAEDDILVVLSPQGVRGRLTQVEAELELSDSRSKRLCCADRSNRRVLTAMLAARRLDMQRAVFSFEQVRNEQRLYTEYAGADWARRDLEELIPVREATSVLAQAEVQFAITSLQVEANDARLADLQLERQTWMRLDAERRTLWQLP